MCACVCVCVCVYIYIYIYIYIYGFCSVNGLNLDTSKKNYARTGGLMMLTNQHIIQGPLLSIVPHLWCQILRGKKFCIFEDHVVGTGIF